jgi:hypothetical protein
MSAVPPEGRDGATPTSAPIVFSTDRAMDRLAHARRHFDLAVDALADTGPWSVKGPPTTPGSRQFVAGASSTEVQPLRWRHHGTDAHLHVTNLGTTRQPCVELYSRTTGRPSPIVVVLEPEHLDVDPDPDALLRRAAAVIRETDDAMGDPETVAATLDTWAWAVAGHLRSRGVSGIRAVDFPDVGRGPRIVGPDALLTEIPHPDMEAIDGIMPRARYVEDMGMDLTITRLRRILIDDVPPGDAMAVLRTTALVARAVERWNGGSRA